MPVLAEDQLLATCTSIIKPAHVKRTLALLQTVWRNAAWPATMPALASVVCTWPVRIWRADARTAFSSADCAKKSRNVWVRPAIRARNGVAINANSTAEAPLLSLKKAPKRLRRCFPAVGFTWAMALLLLCEAGGT